MSSPEAKVGPEVLVVDELEDAEGAFTLGGGGRDSELIRWVCATGILNLIPCPGAGKHKNDTLFWSYHSFL